MLVRSFEHIYEDENSFNEGAKIGVARPAVEGLDGGADVACGAAR